MHITDKAPKVPLTRFKRTKILATVGPATNSYKAIHDMISAGANGIRFNFSHGTETERIQQIEWVRKASKEKGKPVALVQDLQGPKMRLGEFEGIISVASGQSMQLGFKTDYERSGVIPTQYDLSKKVKRGERLYLFDGKIKTEVVSVKDKIVHVRAQNSGILISKKGINLPDTDFAGDIITNKDRKDLSFGSTHDFDYVALSFVQTADDIRKLKTNLNNLGSKAKVIAKIETKTAMDNITSIVQEADLVMIARGDLAVETLPESVPIAQRRIIGLARNYGKPTIVATQMLASMSETPEPTRAEVSDVATAVIVGADCVMLSDETASGKYPIESVKVMKRVIMYTQENAPLRAVFDQEGSDSKQNAIAKAIISLAQSIDAKAIVAETRSGATAMNIASHRPDVPIIAVTSENRTANQLTLVYGVKSFLRPDEKYAATKLTNWLSSTKVLKKGDIVVTASGQYPGVVGTTDTIKVRVL